MDIEYVKHTCYLFSVIILLFLSCNNPGEESKPDITLSSGKWKAFSLKNADQLLLFDTNRNYQIEISNDQRIKVDAEDNVLSGHLHYQDSNSLF